MLCQMSIEVLEQATIGIGGDRCSTRIQRWAGKRKAGCICKKQFGSCAVGDDSEGERIIMVSLFKDDWNDNFGCTQDFQVHTGNTIMASFQTLFDPKHQEQEYGQLGIFRRGPGT